MEYIFKKDHHGSIRSCQVSKRGAVQYFRVWFKFKCFFNKNSMTVFYKSSRVNTVTSCSKDCNINNFFPFMFETTTTFMTSVDNQRRYNGVTYKKEFRAVIQVLVYLLENDFLLR